GSAPPSGAAAPSGAWLKSPAGIADRGVSPPLAAGMVVSAAALTGAAWVSVVGCAWSAAAAAGTSVLAAAGLRALVVLLAIVGLLGSFGRGRSRGPFRKTRRRVRAGGPR